MRAHCAYFIQLKTVVYMHLCNFFLKMSTSNELKLKGDNNFIPPHYLEAPSVDQLDALFQHYRGVNGDKRYKVGVCKVGVTRYTSKDKFKNDESSLYIVFSSWKAWL